MNKIKCLIFYQLGNLRFLELKTGGQIQLNVNGRLKVLPVSDETNVKMPFGLGKVLETTSKYDYVERNYGFFKYQQENLHKSNIYSIKLANSGLNPEYDEKITYYKKAELISILETDNYYHQNFRYIENEDKFYLNIDLTNQKLNNLLNFNMNLPNITSISFNDMYSMSGWGKTLYEKVEVYYKLDEEYVISQKNKMRKNMRDLLETAIRNSVTKYMPVDTTLWKIIYTGK